MLRVAVTILAIVCCLLLMQSAARFGFARLLGKYAVVAGSVAAADQAIALAPGDAEVHRARARVLNRLQMPAEAKKSFEIASSLRYRDDYLWLELGNTRDELGESAAALAAYNQAVRWAPYYAHPLWQRGNLKLRMGEYAEGLHDLRGAAASKKSLVPHLIDLAWGLSRGDVKEVALLINDDHDRLAFAHFLARKGKGKEAVEQARLLVGPLSQQNRQALVQELIAAKAFPDAFELWRADKSLSQPVIVNGGFEEALRFDNNGFGWIVVGKPEPGIVLDASEKLSGATSLLIGFNGEWKQREPLISQTIVVTPQRRYRVNFAVKTKELVTGGPPIIVAIDAVSNQRLAQSTALSSTTDGWQRLSFEFETREGSEGIVLGLQRSECGSDPCPIFGNIWLDEVTIEDVTTVNPQR